MCCQSSVTEKQSQIFFCVSWLSFYLLRFLFPIFSSGFSVLEAQVYTIQPYIHFYRLRIYFLRQRIFPNSFFFVFHLPLKIHIVFCVHSLDTKILLSVKFNLLTNVFFLSVSLSFHRLGIAFKFICDMWLHLIIWKCLLHLTSEFRKMGKILLFFPLFRKANIYAYGKRSKNGRQKFSFLLLINVKVNGKQECR